MKVQHRLCSEAYLKSGFEPSAGMHGGAALSGRFLQIPAVRKDASGLPLANRNFHVAVRFLANKHKDLYFKHTLTDRFNLSSPRLHL